MSIAKKILTKKKVRRPDWMKKIDHYGSSNVGIPTLNLWIHMVYQFSKFSKILDKYLTLDNL